MRRRTTGRVRSLVLTAGCAACYGFSIGAGKNVTYAWRSAIKFPLLLLGTAAFCSLAWFVTAKFLGTTIPMRSVQRSAWTLFRTVAVLLASLSPVTLFLGRSMAPPTRLDLGGYPAFVGLNIGLVAVAGCIALLLQIRGLLRRHGLAPRTAVAVAAAWLVLSLLVGGQLAFWLRPFFGIATLTGDPPFLLGDEPTVTGARNLYEVVWQVTTGADARNFPRGR